MWTIQLCAAATLLLVLFPTPQPGKVPNWVATVKPYLEAHHGDIPVSFLLGWISVESGGKIDEVTKLDERGYFQIHPDESKDLNLDHKRLSTDTDYSLQSGIDLVNHYAHSAESLGFQRGSDVFWHVLKLVHAMGPTSVKRIVADMSRDGIKPDSWQSISAYCVKHRAEILHETKHDPVKWIANVDEVFRAGATLTP